MIAVNINAGLANQMFHYAFGRGLIAKGLDICFDQSNFKPRKQWSFEAIQLQDAFLRQYILIYRSRTVEVAAAAVIVSTVEKTIPGFIIKFRQSLLCTAVAASANGHILADLQSTSAHFTFIYSHFYLHSCFKLKIRPLSIPPRML